MDTTNTNSGGEVIKKAIVEWEGKTQAGDDMVLLKFSDKTKSRWISKEQLEKYGIKNIQKGMVLDIYFESKNGGKMDIKDIKIAGEEKAKEEKKEETTEIEKVEGADKIIVKEKEFRDIKEINTSKIMLSGKVYEIAGKQIADANLTQQIANEYKVITETVEVKIEEGDEDVFGILKNKKVFVKARARRGAISVDAVCYLTLETEVLSRLVEYINKAISGEITSKISQKISEILKREKNINAVMNDDEVKFLFASEVLRIDKFLVRTCETKAQERAQKKILNQEFREEEEIAFEVKEAEIVAKTN